MAIRVCKKCEKKYCDDKYYTCPHCFGDKDSCWQKRKQEMEEKYGKKTTERYLSSC